ncbi:hypothetical protein ACT7DA_23485 [Bacillus pacificus]
MIININADRVREQLSNYDESLMVSEFPLFKLPEDLIKRVNYAQENKPVPHTTFKCKGWFKMPPGFRNDVVNYAFQMLSGL